MAREFLDYEFLWRLNGEGQVSGAHFKQLERITDDATGEIIMQREGPAIPVSDAIGAVSLEVILGKLNTALAKSEDAERQAKIIAESERDAERARRETAEKERDDHKQRADQLASEVEALRNKPIDPDFIPQGVFMDRWSTPELATFYAKKKSDPVLEAFDSLVSRIGGVRLNAKRTSDGKSYLISAGILTPDSAELIFAPIQ